MAGVEAATYRYLATCAFATDDADMVAHWPGRLKVGAALVIGCVAPEEPAHGGAQITLAPRLTLPADQDEAERARIALHAVAARLAAYTRAGRAGRFVWRAWGSGYRLQQARDVQQPCGRCVGNAADARAERERVGATCQRIIATTTREPNAHVFIAHSGGAMERAAI